MRTLFILNLVAALALCDVSAGSEVGSTAEFESAWNSAVSGSTISLRPGASITLSGVSLTPLSGATLSGQTGATLIASPELHLNGSTVRNVQFANSVAGAESVLSISGVCSFSEVFIFLLSVFAGHCSTLARKGVTGREKAKETLSRVFWSRCLW